MLDCDSLSLCHSKSSSTGGLVISNALQKPVMPAILFKDLHCSYSYPDDISWTKSIFWLILDQSSFSYALLSSSHLSIWCGLLLGQQTCFVPLNSCRSPAVLGVLWVPVTMSGQEFWRCYWKGCIADSKLEERQEVDLDVLPGLQKISIRIGF